MSADPLSDLLSLLAPRTYVAGGFDLRGEWSMQFDPHDGIKCFAIVTGACWLAVEGLTEPVQLVADDCFLLPGGRRFRLASNLAIEPVPFADTPCLEWCGGVAVVDGGGEALILGDHFAFSQVHMDMLFGAMPPVAHLRESRDKANLRWALEEMRRELVDGRPGGVLVAPHLAHMMLVQALRLYLAGSAGRHTGWLFALADPRLSAAIAAMHAEPGRRWSLPALAERAGMSRSNFAEAFRRIVGWSPLDYLARWRMLVAGARLREHQQPVSVVAYLVGYRSESAFSTAFKRVMGCSPRQYARASRFAGSTDPWPHAAAQRLFGHENAHDTE